jgi:DNA processing protein
MSMITVERTPMEVLGPLNDVEERNAPERLYLLGDESLLSHVPRVSIVGSRKADNRALERARTYAVNLATEGVVIVSGLAEGIDAAAHEATLSVGGRTIAVLGTGLDRAYPSKNRDLQARIAREHLLVSQFPMGSPVQRKNFPMRNRTMALLTDATIIVEASESSGTLHQGWEALRLGRLLFIDESVASRELLRWPTEMIGYGAQVLSMENLPQLPHELPQFASVADVGF